ncbi:TetR family transcriptional regulator [Nocardia sp. GCM10030253]|uniref:TetR family transcriptional regulator n=1 Tax=Nocardia sp. GCM10030253 TaxID=3273404 RepID=UPI00363A92A5
MTTQRRSAAATGSHRERKKALAQATLQREALRLFREQGYTATTVDQIAAAAGVSRVTFFRYFSTKADVVLHDVADLAVLDALPETLEGINPVRALRETVRTLIDSAAPDDKAMSAEREQLLRTVPELRARVPAQMAASIPRLADELAKRLGHSRPDLPTTTLAGAIVGVAIAAWTTAADDLSEGFMQRHRQLLDDCLALLEAGLTTRDRE